MLGRQFEMPTDHPAGCTVRPGGGNVFMSRLIPQAFFERTGEGAFIWEVQSTVHKLPLLILTLI